MNRHSADRKNKSACSVWCAMKTGRSTPTTSEGYAVPCAPDKPKEGSFKHKNRVLSPPRRVTFAISTEVHYIDASSEEHVDTDPFSRRHQRRRTKENDERSDSDEDLDVFHDEPVLDLSVFHRQ